MGPSIAVTVVHCGVEFSQFLGEAIGLPVGNSCEAGGNVAHREEASTPTRTRLIVRDEVGDGNTVPVDREVLAGLDTAHDGPALVAKLPLTDRCAHDANVALDRYGL